MRNHRGLTKEGKWVYGYYLKDGREHYIFPENRVKHKHSFLGNFNQVIPETVGQFTGFKDKNGKEIYKGDICKIDTGYIFEVKMQSFSLGVSGSGCYGYNNYESVEIIGNIHKTQSC